MYNNIGQQTSVNTGKPFLTYTFSLSYSNIFHPINNQNRFRLDEDDDDANQSTGRTRARPKRTIKPRRQFDMDDDDDDQFRLVSLHEYEDGLVPQFNIEVNNDAVVILNQRHDCLSKTDWMNTCSSLSWISMLTHGKLRLSASWVVTFDLTTKAFLHYM